MAGIPRIRLPCRPARTAPFPGSRITLPSKISCVRVQRPRKKPLVSPTISPRDNQVFHRAAPAFPVRASHLLSTRATRRPKASHERRSEPQTPAVGARDRSRGEAEEVELLSAGVRDWMAEEDMGRPPCRQSENAFHLEDNLRQAPAEKPPTGRIARVTEIRPPSRLHSRFNGEYHMKDASDGLRVEDMVGPDLEDCSETDFELAQTGPILLDTEEKPTRDEIDLEVEAKLKIAARRATAAHVDSKRKTLSNTLTPKSVLVEIPVTLNKRKGTAQTFRGKRSVSRPLPQGTEDDVSEAILINFSAFSRVEPKKVAKKPSKCDHSRTRSSYSRKGSITTPPFMSSLEPEFLNLFARVETHY